MGFLAPWMLFGAAAVSVPIVLHFFFRSRYRTVQWAAMKFLLNSIEQTSRRLKFQELLLLALRCLVLATLAFAMSRPITSTARGTGRGDAVDAIFVMDISYSMGASDGDKSRLERAKTTALEVLDKLPAHSTVRIVTASDRMEFIGPRSPSNLDQGRELIKNLEVASLSSDFAPALIRAKEFVEQGQLPNKELYLFSDMQKSGWDAQESSIKNALNEVKDKANIFLVRTGTRQPKNAAIVGITPQLGVPRPGERIGFAVIVRNTGSEDMQNVVVTLIADPTGQEKDKERTETQTIPTLKAGETKPITLTAKFDKPGSRVLSARIAQDDVPGDNQFDQVIPVRDTVNVLVVNGGLNERDPSKSSAYFLNHALLPIKDTDRAKYFVQLKEVEPRLASPALLAKTDIVFLVNAAVAQTDAKIEGVGRRILPSDFVADLPNWVAQGRGLVIIPGDNVNPENYNRVLGGLLPFPLAKLREFEAKKAIHVDRNTFSLPAFLKFKEDKYFKGFNDIQALKSFEMSESKKVDEKDKAKPKPADDEQAKKDKDAKKETDQEKEAKAEAAKKAKEKLEQNAGETVLRYDNGMPAVAFKRVERGEVFFVATAAEPNWSDWPLSIEFIPFMQTLFAHLLQEQTQNLNLTAGQPLTWHPQEKEPRHYTLIKPDGEQVRLGLPTVKDKKSSLVLPDMTKAGVYRLQSRSPAQDQAVVDLGLPIAVMPDLRESQDFEALTDAQIDGRLGFTPTHVTAGADPTAPTISQDRFQKEWTLWILLVVLGLMFGESTLAWFCGRAW